MNKTRAELIKILSDPLGKRIDQKSVEEWSTSFWKHQAKCSSFKDKRTGKPFVMMLPPPNITGDLHLGHALTAAIQDAIIRQRLMSGQRAIWIPGFDHAGLATQNIVETQLWLGKQITRQQLGREKFVESANQWKDLKTSGMKNQLNRLGLKLEYDREYFTLDARSSHAVQEAFKRLFNSGMIYRAVRPVYWSNQLETTLSDIEVEKINGVDIYPRTGETVEKRNLSQWFVNTREMAHKAVELIEDGSIQMIPPNYKNSWTSWLIGNGVEDWCISRQSWWGHRIPAYKLEFAADVQENWIVANSYKEARQLFGGSSKIIQDPDVLDTWFSSSLLPLTISGWPCPKKLAQSEEEGLFPLDIMETGFDILSYWVSKMVMMSAGLENKIPFKLILLHGMICDSNGKKMSKSKGNVIDPLDVIDGASLKELQQRTKNLCSQGVVGQDQLSSVLNNQERLFPKGIPNCGADGLRAYLLSHDIQEEIVSIQMDQIDKIRRLSNKIWNIFRFALQLIEQLKMHLNIDQDILDLDHTKLGKPEQQVLEELSKCVVQSHKAFYESYQLHRAANSLETFWTTHLSSNYIVYLKNMMNDENIDDETRLVRVQLLISCLVTATKLLHPFMPYLSEFLYQKIVSSLSTSDDKLLENHITLDQKPFPKLSDWQEVSRILKNP